jgi:hypothetical protein
MKSAEAVWEVCCWRKESESLIAPPATARPPPIRAYAALRLGVWVKFDLAPLLLSVDVGRDVSDEET